MKIKIQDKSIKLKGKYRIKTFKVGTDQLIRESPEIENLIVLNSDNGLYLVLNGLLNVEPHNLAITKGKIGYGTSTPTSADTDIETLAVDNIFLAKKERTSASVIKFIFFASDAELPTSGTPYTEFTIHCGSNLFARSIITPSYSKSAGEDTQVEYTITGAVT